MKTKYTKQRGQSASQFLLSVLLGDKLGREQTETEKTPLEAFVRLSKRPQCWTCVLLSSSVQTLLFNEFGMDKHRKGFLEIYVCGDTGQEGLIKALKCAINYDTYGQAPS